MTDEGDRSEPHLYRYRFGSAEYDEARGELRVDGEPVALERRPLALLQALLEQPMQVVSHEELLARIWGRSPEHVSDNVVASAVSKLRKALGPENAALIRSVAGHGYMLEARPERISVGRRFVSAFEFKEGAAVPGREAYLLERPLGSAPRSEVWLGRHVKTKDCRVFKFCSDGERLAALKREFTLYRVLRETLGERDDFARVIDANFETDPYFLECEYGGENLAAWAVHENRLAAMDRPARLRLFLAIARAVSDAHRAGVLHKDLKPSNVLVARAAGSGAEWVARITDFGSGRLLTAERLKELGVEQLGLTMTHGVAADSGSGTLLYLAPEVLGGEAPTTQNDVYALGLMLYQLLAGDLRKPMASGWEAEIGDELLCADIAAATQGRLELRLASVALLVERLAALDERRAAAQRDAEAARRDEAVRAAWRRARARRPWLAALGLALAAGFAASTWQWRRASAEREEARRATERAEAIQAFLRDDVLGGSNPFAAKRAEPTTVREAIAAAASGVDRRFDAHPATEAEVRQALATLMAQYQDYAAAEAQLAQAVPLFAAAFGAGDGHTLKARYRQSILLSAQGKVEESASALREADAAAPGAGGDVELQVLRYRARGDLLVRQQRVAESLPDLERALALARGATDLDPALLDASYGILTAAYFVAGDFGKALNSAGEWLQALKRRPDPPPLGIAYAEQRVAEALMYLDRPAEAEPLIRRSAELFSRLLGPRSATTMMARNAICTLLEQSRRQAETVECLLALHRESLDAKDLPPWVPWGMLGNAGIGQLALGRHAEADASFERALPALRGIPGTDGLQHMFTYYHARAQLALGRSAQALALVGTIRLEIVTNAEPQSPWALRLRLLEGLARARLQQPVEARALLASALDEARREGKGADESVFAEAATTLAGLGSSRP